MLDLNAQGQDHFAHHKCQDRCRLEDPCVLGLGRSILRRGRDLDHQGLLIGRVRGLSILRKVQCLIRQEIHNDRVRRHSILRKAQCLDHREIHNDQVRGLSILQKVQCLDLRGTHSGRVRGHSILHNSRDQSLDDILSIQDPCVLNSRD